jgi:hypothetical protein
MPSQEQNVKYKGDLYPNDRIEFFLYEPLETIGGQNDNI